MYFNGLRNILAILYFTDVALSQQVFDCPMTWQVFQQTCYEFNYYPPYDYADALAACHRNGASLLSVNSLTEHNFIVQQLQMNDALGRVWLTSGVVNDLVTGDLRWEGDGTEIEHDEQWWFNDTVKFKEGRRIVYIGGGGVYGWSRVVTSTVASYICEISQSEAYRINKEDRDYTYGSNITDPEKIPRGPKFIVQPENIVVVPDYRYNNPDEHYYVSIECVADGNPLPEYRIVHIDTDHTVTEVTSSLDSRYTIISGRLVITDPVENLDAGSYQCEARNKFGIVLSNLANITFGYLGDFSNVQRETVFATEYRNALIECGAPSLLPAASYQWYRGKNQDFVRPDLNPHMFISSDGKLYFSEVTNTDESDYNCIVKLTASTTGRLTTDQPPSKVSLPVPLDVQYSSGTEWGPEIADGFIKVFPNLPLRGHALRLECLAYGTMPLTYSWTRMNYPMPDRARMTDHNRILEIDNADVSDEGTYVCAVSRNTNANAVRVFYLRIEAKPYFIFPLQNQHADVGSQLTWRCEGKGIPTPSYTWFKNGQKVVPIPGDVDVRNNVMIIQSLDATRHNGMYECSATNIHGTTYSSAQLRVLAFAPTFRKYPLNPSQMAALGGNITIVCSPEASPRPSYSWTRNGLDLGLPEDDGVSRVRKLVNGNLLITQVQQADAGRYGCTATNMFGTDSSFGQLQVVPNSVITRPPVNTVGQTNMTSALVCEASVPGGADYVYTWRFNERDIDFSGHSFYRLGSTQDAGTLYVTMAQYKHTGMYQCVVKTTLDVATVNAYLTIEGPPGEPAGVWVSSTNSTEAMVHWTVGPDHGRPIEFHTIEAHTDFNSTWVPVASNIPFTTSQILNSDKHRHYVTYLKPGNGYFFRVRAASGLGVGPPSRSSTGYQTQNAPPQRSPDNVGGGGGSVGTLHITWTPLPESDVGAPGIGYMVRWRKYGETRYQEEYVDGNVGEFSYTVGENNFYLQYEVAVKAINVLGEGPYSPDGVLIYSAENSVATNVYAWPFNATAVQVSWIPIPNDRENMRGTLLGYQVNYWERYDPNPIVNAISWRGESDTGIVIGLDPYVWYTLEVQVLNTAGMGPRSELFYSRTYWDAPKTYPTEVHVFSHSEGSMRVTWRGVSTGIGEEMLEGYKVRYWTTTDDIETSTDVLVERGVTEALVYGIQKDRVYEVRVLGYSRGGDGKHSPSAFFTMGGLVAFDPTSSEILASAGHTSVSIVLILFSLFVACNL